MFYQLVKSYAQAEFSATSSNLVEFLIPFTLSVNPSSALFSLERIYEKHVDILETVLRRHGLQEQIQKKDFPYWVLASAKDCLLRSERTPTNSSVNAINALSFNISLQKK